MANLFKSLTRTIKHWYIPLILGIIFILCGIYVFTSPLATYTTLAILFSISFIVAGLLDIFFSLRNTKELKGWGWYLVLGILSLVIGIYLIINLSISIAILPIVVGFTIMFRSFQQLGFALELKTLGKIKWGNLAIASVLGIIFSFMLIANPLFSGISLVVLTGLAFVFVGIASIVLSFDLKKIKNIPNKLGKELISKIEALEKEIEEAEIL